MGGKLQGQRVRAEEHKLIKADSGSPAAGVAAEAGRVENRGAGGRARARAGDIGEEIGADAVAV